MLRNFTTEHSMSFIGDPSAKKRARTVNILQLSGCGDAVEMLTRGEYLLLFYEFEYFVDFQFNVEFIKSGQRQRESKTRVKRCLGVCDALRGSTWQQGGK